MPKVDVGWIRGKVRQLGGKPAHRIQDALHPDEMADLLEGLLRYAKDVPELPPDHRCSPDCPGWGMFEASDTGLTWLEYCQACNRFVDDAEAAAFVADERQAKSGATVRVRYVLEGVGD